MPRNAMDTDEARTELQQADAMLQARNVPQAELYLRRYLRQGGSSPEADALMARVAQGYGVPPGLQLSERSPPPAGQGPRYLLIKAWGYGFWSDVHHLLGQLLVAELTHRTPVVHWGSNSLFGEPATECSAPSAARSAFDLFFEPVSKLGLPLPLKADGPLTVYPPKWHAGNLFEENVNKWQGPWSRHAAPFGFARDEDVVVSDFYMPVATLIPWIGRDSRWFGMSDDAIYTELFAKYLRPRAAITARADAFAAAHFNGRPWVAVHVRGSDKIHESAGLHQTNQHYHAFIDRIIELNPQIGVFLLTDSVPVHDEFSARYARRLVTTPALRSDSTTGVHLQGHAGRLLGEEVLLDVLLAARCHYFIGNQESNVSQAIASIKRWPAGLLMMLGGRNIRSENMFLHRPLPDAVPATAEAPAPPAAASVPVAAQAPRPCRLCASPTERRFERKVLSRHTVGYWSCKGCGSLQTDPPHWLGDAYSGHQDLLDTGKAARTIINSQALPPLLQLLGVRPTDVAVDLGGGTGLFGRLMRDAGYNFHTCDPFGSSEFMGGYVWEALDHRCRVVTLFDVPEHFAEPAEEWRRIFATDPDFVIGSTRLFAGEGADWQHLTPESGRQVFFHTATALAYLAHRAGRHVYLIDLYFLIARHPLDAAAMARLTRWRDDARGLCRETYEAWIENPYRHPSADNAELDAYARLAQRGQRIALDGTFFRFASGISRVWKSLLAQWSASTLASSLVVIDRARTAPRLPGITYVDAPLEDHANPERERAMLQAICDRERIGLFVSTYYTIPLTTPSALMVLDMIPEVMGFDLGNPQWVGKRRAIEYASAFVSISHSTERDLVRFYPHAAAAPKAVAHCGCDFRPAGDAQVSAFKARHGIARPYFLICGSRGDYKNAALFFEAFAKLGVRRSDYAIVCTNANQPLEADMAALAAGAQVHMLHLSDDDLQCAFSGAVALAYPSRYEGFGLPVAEAMACACPVITARNSSIPEVGGEAVIYVDPDSAEQMHQALLDVQYPETRLKLIEAGRKQARQFAWSRMARDVGLQLATWALAVPEPRQAA